MANGALWNLSLHNMCNSINSVFGRASRVFDDDDNRNPSNIHSPFNFPCTLNQMPLITYYGHIRKQKELFCSGQCFLKCDPKEKSHPISCIVRPPPPKQSLADEL